MPKEIRNILLATDGSDGALDAARFASIIAKACAATVTIITVHDEERLFLNAMGPAGFPDSVPIGSLNLDEIRGAIESRAQSTILKDTEAQFAGVADVKTDHVWGQAADEVCRYAQENNFDLIVMGSRGRSAFKRLLLGSVSTQVAQHAPCPVTIVR